LYLFSPFNASIEKSFPEQRVSFRPQGASTSSGGLPLLQDGEIRRMGTTAANASVLALVKTEAALVWDDPVGTKQTGAAF